MRASKNATTAAVIGVYIALLAAIAYTQAPEPHSIEGTIYNDSGVNQVPLGTRFSINDSDSGDYLLSETSIPVPGLSGAYAETINGTDGDFIIVNAWNFTHYGNATRILAGDMVGVDVFLNMTRQGEANVTIIEPSNNSLHNESANFSIAVNVSMIGADALACTATISFSNATFVNVSEGDTLVHQIGDISRGSHNTTVWNVTAKAADFANRTASNFTVSAVCQGQAINLEKEAVKTAANISVAGLAPIVQLMTPANNTVAAASNVNFTFNVSDFSTIQNCSLLINGVFNRSNQSSIEKNAEQGINTTIADGLYNYSVQCLDLVNNTGLSGHHNFTINTTGPVITDHIVTSPIFLTAGTTQQVWCNATATPASDEVNISLFNATLFDNVNSAYNAAGDNNDRYINTTCANATLEENSNAINISCSFNLWYYANNASWTCDLRAKDTNDATGTSTTETHVTELLAVNSTTAIDYGDLQAGNISDDRNVTLFNLGNVPINVTAYGYGRTIGDNNSLTCGPAGENGNISVGYQRHFPIFNAAYNEMTPLANASNQSQILNMTIWQRTSDAKHTNDQNKSYWKLQIPTGIGGVCNGTVILSAIAANLTG